MFKSFKYSMDMKEAKIIVFAAVVIAVFGVVLPYLFSAASTELVGAGILIVAVIAGVALSRAMSVDWRDLAKRAGLVALLLTVGVGCSKVPAGHVGVKVYLLGGAKGVDSEELPVGRYWIGINEELYLFPTFQQNYVWTQDATEGSPNDESFTFQTQEGMVVGADLGISYHLDPTKIPLIFQKYRRGIEEITDVFLRNHVRDALNARASTMSVEKIYGTGRTDFIEAAQSDVAEEVAGIGIVVDKLYLIGSFRLPDNVVGALNSKIEATQRAQQRENELREAEAQAKKVAAEAQGRADAILVVAKAEAEANRVVASSLTQPLIAYKQIERWDGVLPRFTGGDSVPLISIPND